MKNKLNELNKKYKLLQLEIREKGNHLYVADLTNQRKLAIFKETNLKTILERLDLALSLLKSTRQLSKLEQRTLIGCGVVMLGGWRANLADYSYKSKNYGNYKNFERKVLSFH